jgi:hypothetical protein
LRQVPKLRQLAPQVRFGSDDRTSRPSGGRMNRWFFSLALGAGLMFSTSLEAQRGDPVPRGYEPPPGMCRIWIDGVPPARQPAPTDCATAIRRKPPNARVIFGARQEQQPPVTPQRLAPQQEAAPPATPPAQQVQPPPRGGARTARDQATPQRTRRSATPRRVEPRREEADPS